MNEFYQSEIRKINGNIRTAENRIARDKHTLDSIQKYIEEEQHIEQLKQFKSDIENKLL